MQLALYLLASFFLFTQADSAAPQADFTSPFSQPPLPTSFSIDPTSSAHTATGTRRGDLALEVRVIKTPATNIATLRVWNRSIEPIDFPLLRDGHKVYIVCQNLPIFEANYSLHRKGKDLGRNIAGPEFFGCAQLPNSFTTIRPGDWVDIVNLPLNLLEFSKGDRGELTLLISTHTYSGASGTLNLHIKGVASGYAQIPLEFE